MQNKAFFVRLHELYENISMRPGMYYHPEDFKTLGTFIDGTMVMWPSELVEEYMQWLRAKFHIESPRTANQLIEDIYDGRLETAYQVSKKTTKAEFLFNQILEFIEIKRNHC